MQNRARIWKFGDDIDTDVLAPGRYMSAPVAVLASHCLEAIEPAFATGVRQGDIIAAGLNFGAGSSREQAVEALKHLGVAAVIANSFAGIFYRNAINLGLPVLECAETDRMIAGATADLDLDQGIVTAEGVNEPIRCQPMPEFLKAIVNDGGLVPHLEKRFKREAAQ